MRYSDLSMEAPHIPNLPPPPSYDWGSHLLHADPYEDFNGSALLDDFHHFDSLNVASPYNSWLLGMDEFLNSSHFSAPPSPSSHTKADEPPPVNKKRKHKENERTNDEDGCEAEGEKSSAKTKNRRERGPKLAIRTRSHDSVIGDGYKWRKYGQKPVKNNPYPRSYYKCTSRECHVKKHVERCASHPEFVITTYEGAHNHPPPTVLLINPLVLSKGPFALPYAYYPENTSASDFFGNASNPLLEQDPLLLLLQQNC